MHFPAIVLLFVATSTIGFQCPPYERGCRASLLRCGPETGKSFTSFYYTSLRHVLIECEEAPNWVKFKCNNRNAAHDDANRLTFQKCAFPGDYQLKDAVQAVDLIKLDSLTFAHGNLSRIVQNVKAFEGLSGLRELSLFDNGLRDITAELFAVIPDIVLLDLTKNELKDLPSDLFVNLRKLETLELGGNRIGVIEDGTFDPLENLTRLSLRYNLLTTIKPGTFDRLKSLEYLNVKSNKLQQLPSGIFDNLASLKGLHLQNNNFSSLPDGLLRNNLKLTNFHLYNNAQKLTSLPQGFFQNLSSLTALNLKENGLTMLPEDLLHGATSLTIVSFESNTLEYLPQRIFKDMHHLISLNLSNNRLEYLEAGCFENNKELVQLDLSWNLFQHLPNLFLLGFNFILEKINIDFSHNKLVTIGFDKERLMLQLVDSIATLSDREHPIVTVRAEDNPFTCDCDLYSLLQHLESDVQKFVEINVGGTQCRPPRDINLVYNVSVPIAQLDIKKFECPFTLGSHMCPKECTCKTRPYNKVHFINCSYKNLTRVPKKIWSNSDVELDLTGNFIKDIQIDADSGNGYGHVTLLILSHNSLSSLSPLVFTSKLKVLYFKKIILFCILELELTKFQSLYIYE